MSAVAIRPRVKLSLDMPAPARRVVRVDVWPSQGRWAAGWSVLCLDEGDDYNEALNTRQPGEFILVARGCSPRSAMMTADVPLPNVWREHDGSDTAEMDVRAEDCERAADAFRLASRDH